MTLGSSDLQSDSDLDSIRNSCDVSGVDAFGFDGYRSSLRRRISTLGHRLVCVSEPQRFRQRQIKLKQTSSGTDVGQRTTCLETATGRQWWRLLVRRSWRRWIRRQRSTRPDRLKLVLLELNLRKLHMSCLTSSLDKVLFNS